MKQNRCKIALDNVCKNKATAKTAKTAATAATATPDNEAIKKEAIRKFIKSRR